MRSALLVGATVQSLMLASVAAVNCNGDGSGNGNDNDSGGRDASFDDSYAASRSPDSSHADSSYTDSSVADSSLADSSLSDSGLADGSLADGSGFDSSSSGGCLEAGSFPADAGPPVLLGNIGGAYSTPIAVDSNGVYFGKGNTGNPSTLLGCGLTSCASPVNEYVSSSSQITSLVAAGGNLYFIDSTLTSTIKEIAEGGGATASTYATAVAPANFVGNLAADSTNLYYATSTGTSTSVQYSALGAASSPLPSMSGLTNVSAIAVDATNVYALDQTGGFVASCPLAHDCGAAFAKPVSGLSSSNPLSVFSDGTFLWIGTGSGMGKVLRCPTSGCTTPTPWASGGDISSIVADCTNVYWTDTANSVVGVCSVSGTACGTNYNRLATTSGSVGSLVQTATSLYYNGGSQVYELAK